MTNDERFLWLATLKCKSYTLGKNEDHIPNYQTAESWIADYPKDFEDCPHEDIALMISTNTIWRLQVYQHTTTGFIVSVGPTLESVVDDMMGSWKEVEE